MRPILIFLLSSQFLLSSIRRPSLQYPFLVDRFYRMRQQSLFWLAPGEGSAGLRQELLLCIDSAAWKGLDSNRYHPALLRQIAIPGYSVTDSQSMMDLDRIYTDAAIAFCKDLYQGADIDKMISYDAVSRTYSKEDERYLLDHLSHAGTATGLGAWIDSLEPAASEYALLKTTLGEKLAGTDSAACRYLRSAMNSFRWIHHHVFSRYIVVNIPSASLRYFEGDSLRLSMKIVAGQTSKRTPRFAAWCSRVILYPYWNVPRKIAVNELLPLFKKDPAIINIMNMELLDSRGKVIDPLDLPWASYDKKNFPFTVRQSTGCDNALGVVKFDINSPFDVYMHDTNLKSAFASAYRYYSHGCIRLEKPVDLGIALLRDKLDTSLLRSCLKDQRPFFLSLDKPVPVFVVYLLAEACSTATVNYYKDVYHLDK